MATIQLEDFTRNANGTSSNDVFFVVKYPSFSSVSIDGLGGTDTVNFGEGQVNTGEFVVTQSANGVVTVSAASVSYTLRNVETLVFSDATIQLGGSGPSVTSFTPADDASGVAVDANIVATFSAAVQRGSGTVQIKTGAGSVVESFSIATSPLVDIQGSTVTIDPATTLQPGVNYIVEFSTGAFAGLNGAASQAVLNYNFATATAAPPPPPPPPPPPTGQTVVGTAGADALQGGTGNDTLQGAAGDDQLRGLGGNDAMDGGSGRDSAIYSGLRAAFDVTVGPSGLAVNDRSGVEGSDTLTGVERLVFADQKLAFDVTKDLPAGQAALLIGAVLGPAALASPSTVGAVLAYFDSGGTLSGAAQLLVDGGITTQLAGGDASARALVGLIYRNLTGQTADPVTLDTLAGMISGGQLTAAQFLSAAALLDLNQAHIGLAGLASTGLVYV